MLLANILDDFSMLQYFLFRRSSTLDSCNLYVYEIQNASEQKEEEKISFLFAVSLFFLPFFFLCISLHLTSQLLREFLTWKTTAEGKAKKTKFKQELNAH